MEHDWRSAVHVATAVAERLRLEVVVAEGLMCGISEHHMRHPGTLTLNPGAFLAVLDDLMGHRRIGGSARCDRREAPDLFR
jgi:creatinine amidohydrolase